MLQLPKKASFEAVVDYIQLFLSELNLLPRPQTASSNHSGLRTSDLSIDKRKLSHFPFPPKIISVHNFSLDCATIIGLLRNLSLDCAIIIGLLSNLSLDCAIIIGLLRNLLWDCATLQCFYRGVYLSCALYTPDDRVVVTSDDVIPTVEVDEGTPANISQDFHWFLKVS